MQHVPSKPGAPLAALSDCSGSANSTAAQAGASLVSMQDHASKTTPTGAPSNVAEPVYVDDRELARRTSIARATWQKMRHEGRGPAVRKVGRRCVYRWSEVVAWLESHPVGGDAGGGVGP